jgi:hypothetical protein
MSPTTRAPVRPSTRRRSGCPRSRGRRRPMVVFRLLLALVTLGGSVGAAVAAGHGPAALLAALAGVGRVVPALLDLAEPGQGRRATCGCHMGSMSARRGFFWSRADRIGSVTPQSASTDGSSQATPSSSAGL